MAAVTAVLLHTLRPGDTVVLPEDCYYTTRLFAHEHLKAIGVEVRLAPSRGAALANRAKARGWYGSRRLPTRAGDL